MSKKSTSTVHGIADLPATQLAARSLQITRHLDAIDALMKDGVELTQAQRKVALRLQGNDEVEALLGVLDFAEARQELFTDLASEDDGVDPNTFETALLRHRLANAQALSALNARIGKTAAVFSDSALYVATLAKRPTLAAYEIAKPFQERDRQYGKLLNPAIDLYRAHSRAGNERRKATREKAALAATTATADPLPTK